jgi:hypothetical protein
MWPEYTDTRTYEKPLGFLRDEGVRSSETISDASVEDSCGTLGSSG